METQNSPRPDLILLDLNMPLIDGREALGIIKADPKLRPPAGAVHPPVGAKRAAVFGKAGKFRADVLSCPG